MLFYMTFPAKGEILIKKAPLYDIPTERRKLDENNISFVVWGRSSFFGIFLFCKLCNQLSFIDFVKLEYMFVNELRLHSLESVILKCYLKDSFHLSISIVNFNEFKILRYHI
jgi:hypothetical protein